MRSPDSRQLSATSADEDAAHDRDDVLLVRVLISAESFLPAMNGVVHSIVRVVEHLDRSGHEVLVVAPEPGSGSLRLASGASVSVERVPGLALPFYDSLTVGCASSRRLQHIVDAFAPDIVHLAAPVVMGARVGWITAERQIPSVALFQTDLAGFASAYGFSAAANSLWRWLRSVHNRSHLTLAPTRVVAEELLRRGFRRVAVWGRGVDQQLFHPCRRSSSFRQRCGASDDDVLIGYVGRLAIEKRVAELDQIRARSGIRIVVVGDGPDRPRLENHLPGAHFTGFLSGEALGEAVASLDLFVHTGVHETFCQTIQEAMAASVPVVAPASGGPAELVRHGTTGLLYSADRKGDLSRSVDRLIGDAERRQRMGGCGREAVMDRSWDNVGDELLEMYHRVLHLTARSRVGS